MVSDFEVYMVSVTWLRQHVIGDFKLGAVPLEKINSGPFGETYETIAYTKQESKFCQIAIKSAYEVREKVSGQLLYRIPETDIWIIKQDWRKNQAGKFYHYCPSINMAGANINLVVAGTTVSIRIGSSIPDFDFEQLKDDFSGELWHLLTSAHSVAHTTKKTGQAYLPITELVRSFLNSFRQIAKSPKKELKQIVREKPIHEAKPVARTYQKLAINGMNTAVALPSKAYRENIDLYENQYVCQMFSDIRKIVDFTEAYHFRRVKRLRDEQRNAEEAISDLEKPEIVDPVELEEELNLKRKTVEELEAKWEAINREVYLPSDDNNEQLRIRIKNLKYHSQREYWCEILNKERHCLIQFPVVMAKHLRINSVYKFNLCISELGEEEGPKITYKKYEVYSIFKVVSTEVDKERNLLNQTIANFNILSKNNWQADSILSKDEKQKNAANRLIQRNTIQNKINKLNTKIEAYQHELKNSYTIRESIQNVLRSSFFAQTHKRKSIKFRPSMTFIQNAHYKNAYLTYLKIKNAIGIDSDTLDLFGTLEDYTIRELPQVYELWCLVATMRILEEIFGFRPNRKDIINLLASVIPSEKKLERLVKITFSGEVAGRSVSLYYQYEYQKSRKRPDIILHIKHGTRSIYLVLDAKYKSHEKLEYAERESIEMNEKYKEKHVDIFVYTIHPRFKGTENKSLNNTGGKRFSVNNLRPFHQYGFLAVAPGRTDNLRKAIVMSFEYLLEENHNALKDDSIDPKPDYEFVCMNCGGVDFEITTKMREGHPPNPKTRYIYEYKCNNSTCGHTISINYCWNCKTKLFKHGRYWDYHQTSVYSAMDIHCPNCGMTTADRSKMND